ncbi:DUF3857 domain-containing protein [Aquimarina agarivorans]|uniref:DUF3857 domain-containing protein n=1 Tax=Aquimarina agarivorans TaxID=980584 RepID=UPI000248FC90|nr:DUF3857 domain-containing protein [Aquimarina agarivorans]
MNTHNSFLISLVLFFTTSAIFSQTAAVCETYEWDENPTSSFNTTAHTEKDVVAFQEKTINEFVLTAEGGFVEYSLIHNIYWLNSNDKIEEYNKVYLPTSATKILVKNKARVITKSGKIIELDDSKILEAKNEETQVNYKYYAFEGVEKGSFIEYYYVIKRYPAYTGASVYLQDGYYKENVSFYLYSPKNLVFSSKSYNGLPEMVKDTLVKDKNLWTVKLDKVEGLEIESQAPYDTALQKVIYKLDKNTANPTKEYVSYGEVTQNVYKSLYPELDKKTAKALDKFIASILKVKGTPSAEEILQIETYIKSNIFVTTAKQQGLDDIDKILETKIAGETGMMRLYAAIFNKLGVKHEIVLTCPRSDVKFDKDFEVYNFLEDYLIYFPKLKLYMEPLSPLSRLGFPSGNLTDTYGLFIKPVTLGDFTSGLGKVKFIEPVNYDQTQYNLIMNVSFDPDDLTTTNLEMDRKMSGYYALSVQPYLHLAKAEAKDEAIENIIKSINENLEIKEKQVFNDGQYDFGKKPLHITAKMSSDAFVEKAGRKYLFKLGDLIGLQQEMYQEKARKLPVENMFERSYNRKLIVDIPDGYQFQNLNSINIDESFEEDGKVQFMFKSSYEIQNNQLIVSVLEYYNQNIIPVAIYEKYRTIINSAANFNKVTLVLNKK